MYTKVPTGIFLRGKRFPTERGAFSDTIKDWSGRWYEILPQGGGLNLTAGDGGATSGAGGSVTLRGGTSNGVQAGGSISLAPGLGGTNGSVKMEDPDSGLNAVFNTTSIAATDKTFTFPNTSGTLVIGGGTASGTNTGDQTSIVGITGTIAEFNTACTDADFATQTALIATS